MKHTRSPCLAQGEQISGRVFDCPYWDRHPVFAVPVDYKARERPKTAKSCRIYEGISCASHPGQTDGMLYNSIEFHRTKNQCTLIDREKVQLYWYSQLVLQSQYFLQQRYAANKELHVRSSIPSVFGRSLKTKERIKSRKGVTELPDMVLTST